MGEDVNVTQELAQIYEFLLKNAVRLEANNDRLQNKITGPMLERSSIERPSSSNGVECKGGPIENNVLNLIGRLRGAMYQIGEQTDRAEQITNII